MKKLLLAISLLGLVFAESNITAFWGWGWGNNNAPADYPVCCQPQMVTKGCRTRCCRPRLIGRARWSCCRTLNCCRPKRVCCPRYKCCTPKPVCCEPEVPVCEPRGCVTTPRTRCVEDYSNVPTYSNGPVGSTTCMEDPAGASTYPTSYGYPTMHSGYQTEVVGEELA